MIYIGFLCIIYNRILMIKILKNESLNKKSINLSLIPIYAYILYDVMLHIFSSKTLILYINKFTNLPFLSILITLILMGALFTRSYQSSYTNNLWGRYKNYIFEDKKMGLVIFILVIFIGMIGAGVVNFFTTAESERLGGFVIGGITGLFIIFLGYCLITPPIVFWLDYKHLSKFPTDLAEIIHIINKRAKASLNIVPGIQSIELFEVKEQTIGNHIHYNIDNIWTNKHKNSNIGKFKHNSTSISIDFNYEFMGNLDKNKKLPVDILNKYTCNITPRNKGSLIYLNALIDFLNEFSVDNDILFQEWIKGWKIPNYITNKKYRYRSINYLLYFKPIEPFEIVKKDSNYVCKKDPTNEEHLFKGDFSISIETIKKHLYLRNQIGGNSYKKHRQYYNFYFKITHPSEGEKRFVILLTADKRLINLEQICLLCQTMIK